MDRDDADAGRHVGDGPVPERADLTPAARRALAEAEARRLLIPAAPAAVEVQGRGGLEPVRYGDWEVKGLASDF